MLRGCRRSSCIVATVRRQLGRGEGVDVLVGEGIDEHAVSDAEDGRGGADAEGQGENRGDGEAGVLGSWRKA